MEFYYNKIVEAEDKRQPKLVFTEELLQKQNLRGYKCTNKFDICILVHKCEGRLFLTDRNGFYNDLLASQFQSTRGHVMMLLIANRNLTGNQELANKDVDTMITQGDQPTLGFFKNKKRILVYNKTPSKLQRATIAEHIIESLYV